MLRSVQWRRCICADFGKVICIYDDLLQQGEQLYVVDGGGVHSEHAGQPLSQEKVIANLAVFFAQLPVPLTLTLKSYWFTICWSMVARPALKNLRQQILSVRTWRVKDYLKKAGRECSLFSAKSSFIWLTRGMARGAG